MIALLIMSQTDDPPPEKKAEPSYLPATCKAVVADRSEWSLVRAPWRIRYAAE